jgi:hypothetical protein
MVRLTSVSYRMQGGDDHGSKVSGAKRGSTDKYEPVGRRKTVKKAAKKAAKKAKKR